MTRSRIHDENGKVRGNVAIGIAIGVMLVAMIPAVTAIVSSNNNSNNALMASSAEASHTETFRGIKLPQPNDEDTLVKARASGALYEPAAGLSNVFGPSGLFPFEDTFDCADSLACGVSAGSDARFRGVFEQGNDRDLTHYTATYTAPVTYGDHQIQGHKYRIILTDTVWNTTGIPAPTRQVEFLQMVNNVGFNQIQHGASHIDRSDVPQLYDTAFLYGHAKVIDESDNDRVVAEDIFTHVMVAHVMDENNFYRSLRDDAQSPTLVFLFAINIPSGVELPNGATLTPEQAQSFTPLPSDPSLENPPQVDYPVSIPEPRGGAIDAPESQSTTWPVDNPEQPLFFTFLVYQDTQVKLGDASEHS